MKSLGKEEDGTFTLNGLLILCDKCTKPLSQQGALIFTPPDRFHNVKKYHLCVKCFEDFKQREISKVVAL